MQVGHLFPIEKLANPQGNLSLDDSAYTVIYFYPRDDTPGCTIEANEFQKLKPTYDQRRIRIVGVSVDGAQSHAAFCDKFSLAFELATDEGGALGQTLDIMKGAVHRRVTFVLDAQGKVVLVYPEVKPAEHAQQILDDIAKL
ncbi:MAG: peroxiredoxin [Methylococcaceae bacterium]|nr:peroxiredoxin [Methylococcaceae bacterium]